MGSRGAQWYSRPEQADQHHGFADFYQRFFGETPSQKTPDTGLTSIRVAKLGNAYTGQPPQRNRSSMLRSAYPPFTNPCRTSWTFRFPRECGFETAGTRARYFRVEAFEPYESLLYELDVPVPSGARFREPP